MQPPGFGLPDIVPSSHRFCSLGEGFLLKSALIRELGIQSFKSGSVSDRALLGDKKSKPLERSLEVEV
jgi:hypothetical protein